MDESRLDRVCFSVSQPAILAMCFGFILIKPKYIAMLEGCCDVNVVSFELELLLNCSWSKLELDSNSVFVQMSPSPYTKGPKTLSCLSAAVSQHTSVKEMHIMSFTLATDGA